MNISKLTETELCGDDLVLKGWISTSTNLETSKLCVVNENPQTNRHQSCVLSMNTNKLTDIKAMCCQWSPTNLQRPRLCGDDLVWKGEPKHHEIYRHQSYVPSMNINKLTDIKAKCCQWTPTNLQTSKLCAKNETAICNDVRFMLMGKARKGRETDQLICANF